MAGARWKPMLCEVADAIPYDPHSWVLEPKFDGWRTLVVIEPAGVTVQIRAGVIATFRNGFGREPARVGVAVLPWVGELDDDA